MRNFPYFLAFQRKFSSLSFSVDFWEKVPGIPGFKFSRGLGIGHIKCFALFPSVVFRDLFFHHAQQIPAIGLYSIVLKKRSLLKALVYQSLLSLFFTGETCWHNQRSNSRTDRLRIFTRRHFLTDFAIFFRLWAGWHNAYNDVYCVSEPCQAIKDVKGTSPRAQEVHGQEGSPQDQWRAWGLHCWHK